MLIYGIGKLERKLQLHRKTILKLHRKYGFPIRRLGGRWVTTSDLAHEWFKENIDLFVRVKNHSLLIRQGKKLKSHP